MRWALRRLRAAWRALRSPGPCLHCPRRGPGASGAPGETVEVAAERLRYTVDTLTFAAGLPDGWLRSATSDEIDSVAGSIELERAFRRARWAAVERGLWPAPVAAGRSGEGGG